MEWIEKWGAAGAFVLMVIRMFLDSRSAAPRAFDVLQELDRERVTPERLGRMMEALDKRFDVLPEVVLKHKLRQLDDIHEWMREMRRGG